MIELYSENRDKAIFTIIFGGS